MKTNFLYYQYTLKTSGVNNCPALSYTKDMERAAGVTNQKAAIIFLKNLIAMRLKATILSFWAKNQQIMQKNHSI